MNLSTNFFSKLNSKSQQVPSKPERKARQYILFNDLVINPEPYEGRDSLLHKQEAGERYVNPKSSFYLCKVIRNEVPFEKLPTHIIRRVAYRKGTKTDQLGRVVYNDAECKNLDQISTEFHCYRLLKQSLRTVQMLCLSHENTQCAEDRRLYYQVMRLPDRRAQGIKNVMFVLEEMNEGSLKEHIDRIQAKKQDPFTEHEVIEYTCQIAEGLQELKRRGIIHRDLRPENILFHNKQIKISDFDSAFIKGYSDYRNIRNGLLMKDTTPLEIMQLIAEPEDRLKKLTSDELWDIQQHADVYFLGVNIYTMVFSHPFETFNGGKILHNLINIKKRNGFCPKLLDLMARCLEKDVHKRVTLEEVTGRLGEIEKETFHRHATYTRVYTTSDPLNLYNFSSNQIEQKLECEAGDFVVFQNIIKPVEMEEDF
jgi:serine/threonine protein kinase